MDDRVQVKLGDHIDLLAGFAFSSKDFTEGDADIRLLRGVNVSQGIVKWNDEARFPEHLAGDYKDFLLCADDIVLAMDRPWVEAGLKWSRIRPEDLPLLLVQRVCRLRGSNHLLQQFLAYIVDSPSFAAYLKAIATGVAVPHISSNQIQNYELVLPSLSEQRRICAVLEPLDALVVNNRRRIELLEETARLLYREWFVNFRYPGHEGMPLADSEIGPIPEGWRVTSLDQRACLSRSSITPGDYPGEMFDHFSLPAFDEKSEPEVESGESIKSNKYLIEGECVLWSKLNPRFPRVWWTAPLIGERRPVASTEFLVLAENGGWRLPFIYSVVGSELFSLTMAARANGTSTSHQRVAPSDVMTYPILDPEDSIQERFSELVEPVLQLKSDLIIQNRSLAQIRDLLLPRLVSGDLDVSDLELDLEAVG